MSRAVVAAAAAAVVASAHAAVVVVVATSIVAVSLECNTLWSRCCTDLPAGHPPILLRAAELATIANQKRIIHSKPDASKLIFNTRLLNNLSTNR